METPKSRPLGIDSSIIMGALAAAAFFILFISMMTAAPQEPHANMRYGVFNTTEILDLYNTTYLKVYYSDFCPACATELPILQGLADNGTLIEMIEINQQPDAAQADSVIVTPTIFVIDGPAFQRLEGFTTADAILKTMGMVRDKSKLKRG